MTSRMVTTSPIQSFPLFRCLLFKSPPFFNRQFNLNYRSTTFLTTGLATANNDFNPSTPSLKSTEQKPPHLPNNNNNFCDRHNNNNNINAQPRYYLPHLKSLKFYLVLFWERRKEIGISNMNPTRLGLRRVRVSSRDGITMTDSIESLRLKGSTIR